MVFHTIPSEGLNIRYIQQRFVAFALIHWNCFQAHILFIVMWLLLITVSQGDAIVVEKDVFASICSARWVQVLVFCYLLQPDSFTHTFFRPMSLLPQEPGDDPYDEQLCNTAGEQTCDHSNSPLLSITIKPATVWALLYFRAWTNIRCVTHARLRGNYMQCYTTVYIWALSICWVQSSASKQVQSMILPPLSLTDKTKFLCL